MTDTTTTTTTNMTQPTTRPLRDAEGQLPDAKPDRRRRLEREIAFLEEERTRLRERAISLPSGEECDRVVMAYHEAAQDQGQAREELDALPTVEDEILAAHAKNVENGDPVTLAVQAHEAAKRA